MKKFDVVVIGSGPGGYPAAIRAAQRGASVALVEGTELGGTCLNRGCIPSKTLIEQARLYHAVTHAEGYGIHVEGVSFDFSMMAKRKDKVVGNVRKGLEGLLRANGVVILRGMASFRSPKELKVVGEDNEVLYAEKTIIASGSEPKMVPLFPCDHQVVCDSTSLLEKEELPKKLGVIGGGVIGCEFASMYHLLGVEVAVFEMLPRLLSTESADLSKELLRIFKKRGIEVFLEAEVEGVGAEGEIRMKGGETVPCDRVLVAVGRKINSDRIGLQQIGLPIEKGGAVAVNERMETAVPGIYAIGDVLGKWWLAHVATHQGIVAAENATGGKMVMDEHAVPAVTFTDPEVASVGLSEEEAKRRGYSVVVGRFPFQVLGKAQASGHTEGFAQVIADKKTGQILGGEVIGHETSTLIAEMALAVNNELTLDCVFDTIHAHPTLSEAWMEACLLAAGRPLHLPPKKRAK